MAVLGQGDGRVNQRRRTRDAITAAASELLAQGRTPSVAEAAEVALVSRTTAYRYFPTQQALLLEAALAAAAAPLDHIFDEAALGDDAAARIEAVARAFNGRVLAHETEFRTMLRLFLEEWSAAQQSPDADPFVRAGRRLRWIDSALAPLHGRLSAASLERVRAAVAMVMGIEAVVVARDVCQLDADTALEVMAWAARTLVSAAEADAP